MMQNKIFDYSAISDDCIKCGKCKPVCPIFEITHDEAHSPRGFIDLLGAYHNDNLDLDKNAKSIFETCFLCTSCVEVCPNDLPTDVIIEQVRYDIAKKFGLAWYKKVFFFLLRHRKIMDFMAKIGWVFQTCAVKIDEQKSKATFRINLPIQMINNRAIPFAKRISFLNKNKENIKSNHTKKQELKHNKVALFIGCMGNYSYTNTGESLLNVLDKLGIDVLIPKKQLCCSAPAYFTGDFKTVDVLSKKNIEYFETFIDTVDAIVVPEATCSAMINIDWEHFFHDQPQWAKRASKIAPKVQLATKWLAQNTNLQVLLKENGKKMDDLVTYHDPCHAKKMQKVYNEPRELIQSNYKMTEMSNSSSCCGFGGVTMQSENYHLSVAAGKPKAQMIDDTKAQIVSAECSACRMQITNSLHSIKSDVIFKNPIELISDSLKDDIK